MSVPAHVSLARKRKKQSEKMSFSCHASLYIAHLHTRAPGHSTASLPGHLDPQHEWDCAVHHCPTPLPKRTDQPGSTELSSQCCSSLGWQSWRRTRRLGAGLTWRGTAIGLRVRAALLTGRQWMSTHPGYLWEWEVNALDLWAVAGHGTTSLPLPHYIPFYLFAFARLHRLCCSKKEHEVFKTFWRSTWKKNPHPKVLNVIPIFYGVFLKGCVGAHIKSSELSLQPCISLLDRHTVAADLGAPPSPCLPPLCSVLQCLGMQLVSTHRFWGRINLKASQGFWRLAVLMWGEQQQPMPCWLSWPGSLRLVGGRDWVTWQKS